MYSHDNATEVRLYLLPAVKAAVRYLDEVIEGQGENTPWQLWLFDDFCRALALAKEELSGWFARPRPYQFWGRGHMRASTVVDAFEVLRDVLERARPSTLEGWDYSSRILWYWDGDAEDAIARLWRAYEAVEKRMSGTVVWSPLPVLSPAGKAALSHYLTVVTQAVDLGRRQGPIDYSDHLFVHALGGTLPECDAAEELVGAVAPMMDALAYDGRSDEELSEFLRMITEAREALGV